MEFTPKQKTHLRERSKIAVALIAQRSRGTEGFTVDRFARAMGLNFTASFKPCNRSNWMAELRRQIAYLEDMQLASVQRTWVNVRGEPYRLYPYGENPPVIYSEKRSEWQRKGCKAIPQGKPVGVLSPKDRFFLGVVKSAEEYLGDRLQHSEWLGVEDFIDASDRAGNRLGNYARACALLSHAHAFGILERKAYGMKAAYRVLKPCDRHLDPGDICIEMPFSRSERVGEVQAISVNPKHPESLMYQVQWQLGGESFSSADLLYKPRQDLFLPQVEAV
jgi:hypothetical protein